MTTIKAIRLASLVTAINVLVASGFSIAAIIRPQYLVPAESVPTEASLLTMQKKPMEVNAALARWLAVKFPRAVAEIARIPARAGPEQGMVGSTACAFRDAPLGGMAMLWGAFGVALFSNFLTPVQVGENQARGCQTKAAVSLKSTGQPGQNRKQFPAKLIESILPVLPKKVVDDSGHYPLPGSLPFGICRAARSARVRG